MELPKRKNTRLKEYDYSQNGLYFVTICTENKEKTLSTIDIEQDIETAETTLTRIGNIAEKYLVDLENRYPFVKIDTYVIMPDHIHFLIAVLNDTDKKKQLSSMVCSYKSLVTKEVREKYGINKIFQRSYFDHIIRNEKDHKNTFSYIIRNPGKWIYDKYYSDK